jgi:hypothetical protein
VAGKSPTAKAIRYALSHWAGLIQFIDDGRIDPLVYLGDTLARLAQGYPINPIAELPPWRWSAAASTD